MSETEKIVTELVAQVLGCETGSLSADSRIGRHENWDSLHQLMILTALEETFGITVDDENIDQLLSIGNICRYLESDGVQAV